VKEGTLLGGATTNRPKVGAVPTAGAGSAVSVTNASNQLITDPDFADTTPTVGYAGTDPYWSQYSSSGLPTIDDRYYEGTSWTTSPGDYYTADLCGYTGCGKDEVSQGFTVPGGITAATLAFAAADGCLVGPCTGTTNLLSVGLFNPTTGAEVYASYYDDTPTDHYTYPPEGYSISGSALATFLKDSAGETVDLVAVAATSGSDDSQFWLTDFTLTLAPPPPSSAGANSTTSGAATVNWTEPPAAVAAGEVTGYSVTTFNDQGTQVGTPQPVAGGSTSSTTVTGLADGTPWYFGVAAVNAAGVSTAVESNSVTPLSGATPAAGETAVSSLQYLLPNSSGAGWQVMDESNLAFSITPSSSENVLLSANADLWTFNAGYNQDIGIQVTPGSGTPVLAAWKESGGFAGTFSPNAAFVETVYPMSAGTTYTVQIVWKTNKAAIGATIAAGAGPISSAFSPTRLTADVLPAGYQSVVSTTQYSSINSNGSTWAPIDPTNLVTTAFAPSSAESVVVSGNADLWTANAGYNQDLGIFVSVNGATPTLVAWKESGGFAGTFSPNAAFVQTVYPMTAGDTYVFSLEWKTNKPSSGTIFAGAGPIGSAYSSTRLTAYPLPADAAPDQWQSVVSTKQYSSINSNGSTWGEMDATNLATGSIAIGSGGTAETVLVSGNADLWTANAGYNQDLGIEVSVNGATPTLVAWKESGGFAGTFSPNAAFVQGVYTLEPGNSYVFSLWWKTNKPANGTIFAGAGPIGSAYSPTRLTVVPQT
jgi:hypothetical protein